MAKFFNGDANLDGEVNVGDLALLSGNWQQTGTTWSEADFNGDRITNVGDLAMLSANWGRPWDQEERGGDALPALVDQDGDDDFDIDDIRIIVERWKESHEE